MFRSIRNQISQVLCIPAKNTQHGVVVQRSRTPVSQAGNSGSNPDYVTRGRNLAADVLSVGLAINGKVLESGLLG